MKGEKNIESWGVRNTLNEKGGHTDNRWSSRFADMAKINVWSRYKPVCSKVYFFSLEEWKESGYRGEDGQCGIEIPVFGTLTELTNALKNGSALWKYNAPDGKDYPMRAGDWRLYNEDAVNPIGDLAKAVYLQVQPGGFSFDLNVEVVVDGNNDTYNLTLPELMVNGISLGDMYLGAYLVNGNRSYLRTGTQPIRSGDVTITMDGDSGMAGKYMAYVFLSSVPQTDEQRSGTMIGINKNGVPFEIKEYVPPYAMASALWDKEAGTVDSIEVLLVNDTGKAYTFTGIVVNLIKVGKGESPEDGEPMTPIYYAGSVEVEAGKRKTVYVTGVYRNIVEEKDVKYYMMGYADGVEPKYSMIEEHEKS